MKEIYKSLNSPENKEFAKLLNDEFKKSTIEEGKVYEGTITKISNSNKICWVELPSGKSEGILDDSETRILKNEGKLKVGEKIKVMLLKEESKSGELIISHDRAKNQTNGMNYLKLMRKKKKLWALY